VPLRNKVGRAALLAQPDAKTAVSASPAGVRIQLPARAPDAIATVIALPVEGEPQVIAP
jgi:hypothetical protein